MTHRVKNQCKTNTEKYQTHKNNFKLTKYKVKHGGDEHDA
jgi:hypothetical protein